MNGSGTYTMRSGNFVSMVPKIWFAHSHLHPSSTPTLERTMTSFSRTMVSPNHLSPSVQGGVGSVVLQATQGRPVLKVVESEFSPSLCFSLLSPSLPVCLIMYEFVLEYVYFISCYHQLLVCVPTSTHPVSELYHGLLPLSLYTPILLLCTLYTHCLFMLHTHSCYIWHLYTHAHTLGLTRSR